MRLLRSLLAGAAVACALAALVVWLWPRVALQPPRPAVAPEPPARPAPAAAPEPEALEPGPAAPPAPAPPEAAAAPEPEPHEAESADHDLLLYERRPMSQVPHRVVRGWGAVQDRQQPGRVGAYVVVEPSISDEELLQLARDIRDYHRGASAVAVRILDSEAAANYDYHDDGGVFRDQHVVARVNRDANLGVDKIVVRGTTIEP